MFAYFIRQAKILFSPTFHLQLYTSSIHLLPIDTSGDAAVTRTEKLRELRQDISKMVQEIGVSWTFKTMVLQYIYSRRSAGSARTKVTRCHKRKCRCRSRSNINSSKNLVFSTIFVHLEGKMLVFTMFLQHQGQN